MADSKVTYESTLTRYANSLDRRTERAKSALGKLGERVAQSRARRKTGRMRTGISWAATSDEVVASVPYTRFHEFGTKYIDAQPMLGPALSVMDAQAGEEFQQHLDPGVS